MLGRVISKHKTLAEDCWQESGGFESCVLLELPSYWVNSHQSHGMLSWGSINLFPTYVAPSENVGAGYMYHSRPGRRPL